MEPTTAAVHYDPSNSTTAQIHHTDSPLYSEAAYEALHTFKTILQLYFAPAIAAVGLVVNVLTIIVLGRDDSMNVTTSFLLRMLATADFFNLLFLVPMSIKQVIGLPQNLVDLIEAFTTPFQMWWYGTSIWLEVLLTLERYIAVCYPLQASGWITLPRVKVAAAVIWIIMAVGNVWHVLQKRVKHDEYGEMYLECWYCNNAAYSIIYYSIIFPVFGLYLPFGLLIFFTARILGELRKSVKQKLELISAKKDEQKELESKNLRATVTLLAIVVVFIISEIVNSITLFLVAVNHQTNESHPLIYNVFYAITAVVATSQATCNFFLFALTGKKYRQILREAFHCKKI